MNPQRGTRRAIETDDLVRIVGIIDALEVPLDIVTDRSRCCGVERFVGISGGYQPAGTLTHRVWRVFGPGDIYRTPKAGRTVVHLDRGKIEQGSVTKRHRILPFTVN